jgi:PST family polysaccharide transporter
MMVWVSGLDGTNATTSYNEDMPGISHHYDLLQKYVLLVLQYSLNAVVPLLVVPHIVKTIGLENFGLIAVALGVANYLSLVVQFVFHLTGPTKLAVCDEQTHRRVVLECMLARGLLLSVVYAFLFFFLLSAPMFTGDEIHKSLLLILMPLVGFFNFAWYLQYRDRFAVMVLGSGVGAIASGVLAFKIMQPQEEHVLVWASLALVIAPLLANLTSFLATCWVIPRGKLLMPLQPLKLIQHGRELFMSQFVSMGYTASGVIVISVLAGTTSAGYYAVIERLMNVVSGGMQLLHTAAYPRLTKAYHLVRKEYFITAKFVFMLHSIGVLFLSTLVWVAFDQIVLFFFAKPEPIASILLSLGLVWVWVCMLGTMLTGYLVISNQSRLVFKLNLKILMFTFALGLPGAYLFGAAGWLCALILSQSLILRDSIYIWRKEVTVIKKGISQ